MVDAAGSQNWKPYGVCPFDNFKCVYGRNGASKHGFACPDHARLHAYIDHKVSFTDVNKHKGNFKGEYDEGCCATQRFFPFTVDDLARIPPAQQENIHVCDGELSSFRLEPDALVTHGDWLQLVGRPGP